LADQSQAEIAQTRFRRTMAGIRGRMLGGLLLVLPILITLWVIHWPYTFLEVNIIDPLALFVLWKIRQGQPDTKLPHWFEAYAAPFVAILFALVMLYLLEFIVNSKLRHAFDWIVLRVPVVSTVYNGVRNVFQTLNNQRGQKRPQRVVLIGFPHPGTKVPAFVTATCKDIATGKTILCVYVPTTPVPTSGYLLLVPEDEVTELNWTSEQAVQAIISAGLTAPPEVSFFGGGMTPSIT